MDKKLVFYDRYGVENITCMTPDKGDLSGWLRTGERLDVIGTNIRVGQSAIRCEV